MGLLGHLCRGLHGGGVRALWSRRYGAPLALLLVDLDGLKRINA